MHDRAASLPIEGDVSRHSRTMGGAARLALYAVPGLVLLSALDFPFASGISNGPRAVAAPLRWLILLAFAAVELPAVLHSPRAWFRELAPSRYHLVWTAFLAVAVASASWSLAPRSSFTHAVSVGILAFAALVSVWRYARTPERRALVAAALFIGVATVLGISLVVGLVDPALGRQTDLGSNVVRWRGIFENPNELGLEGLLVVPLAVTHALVAHGARRLVGIGVLALALALITLSGTRSSLALAVLVALALTGLHGHRRRAALLGLVALGVAVLGTIAIVAAGKGSFLRLDTTSTLSGRTEAWSLSWQKAQDRPVTGFGFATEPAVISQIRSEKSNDANPINGPFRQFAGGHVESSYVGALVQLGWLGIVLLALQLLFPLVGSVRASIGTDPWLRAFGLLFVSGALMGIVESYLWSAGNFATFPVWCAAAIAVIALRASAHDRVTAG